mmetsp:Transcript_19109/g.36803  ORF Transcript_19109/g.36803 Transcript_19109/m.36803 type:complete len:512 (-) Transcript_19109:200-1735(-)
MLLAPDADVEATWQRNHSSGSGGLSAERQLRVRRVLTNSNLDHVGEKINEKALYQLLKHVKIDPDGGILNLVDNPMGQKSKVPALTKNSLQTVEAVFAAFRTVSNPAAMIFASSRMLHRQLCSADGVEHLRRELSRLRMGHRIVEFSFIGANLMELSLAVGCILLTLYHVFRILCQKNNLPPVTEISQDAASENLISDAPCQNGAKVKIGEVNPRYMYEAEFWLADLPRLQNLSCLRLLAYVHPNLLEKRRKQFCNGNDMSRAILEGFFGCKDHYLTDEQLVEEIAKVIVQSDGLEHTDDYVEELCSLNPSQALCKLQVYKNEGRLKSDEKHNPKMLDRIWRLNLFWFGEMICFGMLVTICFMLGTLEFFHKICRCSLILTDPTAPMMTCALFFLLFLNQALGIMHIGWLLRWRVETFIFGGTDAVVSTEEKHIMQMYLGELVERIWGLKVLNGFQKLTILLGLNDDDLQQLVVEESEAKKAAVTASIRKYMDKRGLSSGFNAALTYAVAG